MYSLNFTCEPLIQTYLLYCVCNILQIIGDVNKSALLNQHTTVFIDQYSSSKCDTVLYYKQNENSADGRLLCALSGSGFINASHEGYS